MSRPSPVCLVTRLFTSSSYSVVIPSSNSFKLLCFKSAIFTPLFFRQLSVVSQHRLRNDAAIIGVWGLLGK